MKNVGELVRLIGRRERVVLPMWILIFGLLPVGIASGFAALFPTEAEIQEAAGMMAANPAFVALLGEVHAPTLGGLTAWRSIAPLALGVGIVSVLAVVRHTRTEEQSGRRELIASTVLGRDAPLVAALGVVGAADLLIGAISAAALIGYGLEPAGSVAFGAVLAASGWIFAGVAAVASQIAESGSTANGMGMAVIGVSFVMRMVGDAGAGTDLEILSWLSPIGLAQRVRPFAVERPSVLVALMAAAVVVALSAQVISRRRDVGAGLVAARPGRATASSWLAGPLGLAVRVQREVATSWLVGFALVGAMVGAVTESFVDLMLETPALAVIVASVGGMEAISDAFLASMFALFGVVAAAHGVQAGLWLRTEEVAGRAENVLSTRVGRPEWMSSHVVIAVVVPALDLLIGGAAAGLSYGATVGDPSQSLRLAGAALVSLPAAWILTGVGLALFGFVPHISRVAWSLVGAAGLLTLLGRALGLDQWVLNLSPFTHTPAMPSDTLTLTPLVWMTVVAVVLIAAAYRAVQHRDMETL